MISSILPKNVIIIVPCRNVIGLHLNMVNTLMFTPSLFLKQLIGGIAPSLVMDPKDAHKVYPFWEKMQYLLKESGYMHIQATKPDTVGMYSSIMLFYSSIMLMPTVTERKYVCLYCRHCK